ncbi:CBO0543 family protein [Neobacillus sp. DY30]|uniref:CBO0543 family protein n=1 Tax=Neobacillus sp. DY30 TaxID=3047871 RepID=UPI0024BF451F|nr:CBO0543 family protein [Neobacillus sp. DY30]WHY03078.1 CBO0543 family protein [Neobacillus sp. DY30]
MNGLFLIAGLKWGDWRNWSKYHSTILFFWFGDLLYNFLCKDYLMWEYKETMFGQNILPNHLTISLLIMFVAYPATVLIFLGNLPDKTMKKVLWLLFWVALFSLVEYINLRYLDLIEHHHQWTMAWSVFFNLIVFFILLLHNKHPIAALIISIPIILFFVMFFDVPIY